MWTAIDTERFTPAARAATTAFVLGWTGSGSSLRYLRAWRPPSARFLAEAPEARLVVMADAVHRPPRHPRRPDRPRAVEPRQSRRTAIQDFDVGLMPLGGGDWAKGKCAFKMLQYLACAVPAVVSPVGMNAEVLAMADVGLAATTEDEWVEALLTLYRDRDTAPAARSHRSRARRARLLRAGHRSPTGGGHAPLPMSPTR